MTFVPGYETRPSQVRDMAGQSRYRSPRASRESHPCNSHSVRTSQQKKCGGRLTVGSANPGCQRTAAAKHHRKARSQ